MKGEHDWRYYDLDPDESPAESVIILVASDSSASVSELDPLTETIDVEAVNQLFVDDPDDGRRLEFEYNDYVVRVTPDWIGIKPV